MPNLNKSTKCIKIRPSQVSKYTHKALFSMLFPFLWAIWPQNEKPLFRSIMAGYSQIMVGYHSIMQGYCTGKDAYSITDDRWQFSHEQTKHGKVPLCRLVNSQRKRHACVTALQCYSSFSCYAKVKTEFYIYMYINIS